MNKKIVLFDGVCNLCNSSVQKIIKYDKNDVFRFASLQSEKGIELRKKMGLDTSKLDSIILYEPGESYEIKTTAALKIMVEFGGFWKIAHLFLWIPAKIRDPLYDILAANRYKWFGKKESCMIPTPEIKAKFLD